MTYTVFTRNFYKRDPKDRNKRIPHLGRKTILATGKSYEEAVLMCKNYNEKHNEGFLSKKAEFERE